MQCEHVDNELTDVVPALLTACSMACGARREVSEQFPPGYCHCQMCAGARACRTEERAFRSAPHERGY
jgi:hypothetical protein